MKSRIGCYVRVSTSDKNQSTLSQRTAIKNWAKTSHIKPTDLVWYEDMKSGASEDRPKLQKLLRDIDKKKIDTLVVFKLDRLARNTRLGLEILASLGESGTKVVSVSENIEFGNSTGRLIASILLSVASWEREVTIDRIKAGMLAARMSGKHIGRPRDMKRLNQIRLFHKKGLSVIDIATKLSCTRQNVYAGLAKTA